MLYFEHLTLYIAVRQHFYLGLNSLTGTAMPAKHSIMWLADDSDWHRL